METGTIGCGLHQRAMAAAQPMNPFQCGARIMHSSLVPYNGLRLSCNRAQHVVATSGWPGAVDSSKRVLGGFLSRVRSAILRDVWLPSRMYHAAVGRQSKPGTVDRCCWPGPLRQIHQRLLRI